MKALILTANGARDCELLFACCMLQEEGIVSDVAGPQAGIIIAEHGYAVTANMAFADVDVARYSLLVLAGPKGSDAAWLDASAARVVKAFIEAGRAYAPVCRDGWIGMSALPLEGQGSTRPAGTQCAGRTWGWERRAAMRRCPGDLPPSWQAMFQALRNYCNCPVVHLAGPPLPPPGRWRAVTHGPKTGAAPRAWGKEGEDANRPRHRG